MIPGPPKHPLGRRVNADRYARDPIAYTARVYHEYGDVAALVRDDCAQVFAFGAENNRTVLSRGDEFHTVLEYLVPPRIRAARRGIGLLNMNGPEHRDAKRLVSPSFKPAEMGRYAGVVDRYTLDELRGWRAGETIDLSATMRRLTLRIACRSFFGVDIAEQSDVIGGMVRDMLRLRYFAPSIRYFPFDLPGTPYRRLLRVIRSLDDALAAIIETRRSSGDDSPDLLQSLLREPLTDDQLVGHLTTLLVAGHETSSNTLCWAFLLLAAHPDDEPDLDGVVKETLRLLPPGPNTSRITRTETRLGDHAIPANAHVVTSKYVTHRDPRVFPEPLRFLPGRWETARPTAYQYLPYGAGAHACVGAAFADMEMKVILRTVRSRFALSPVPGHAVNRDVGLMMSPRGGLPMRVFARGGRPPRPPRIAGDINEMVDVDGEPRWRLGW